MQITYLSDLFYNTDFLYALIFLTFGIWLAMKVMFNYDNVGKAFMFAIMAVVFLPFVVSATQIGNAFILVLLLGGLVISQTYKWPLSTSILMMLVALLSAAIIFPAI